MIQSEEKSLVDELCREFIEAVPVPMLLIEDRGDMAIANRVAVDLIGPGSARSVADLIPGWSGGAEEHRSAATARVRRFVDGVSGLTGSVDITLTPVILAGRTFTSVVIADRRDQPTAQSALLHKATHDQLTGLLGREPLFAHLESALARTDRLGTQVAVLFIDLDGFKDLNDTRGHTAGDEVLRMVARRLKGSVREGDTLARYGGDEFVAVIEGHSAATSAHAFARRVSAAISEPVDLGSVTLSLTASIGVAVAEPGDTADFLVAKADRAMYDAKHIASGHTAFDASARREVDLLQQALRDGIESHEVVPYYQPIIDLSDGAVVGVEALARWVHPDGHVSSPDEFIPLAEDCGLVVPLGLEILSAACRDAVSWHSSTHEMPEVSVNVSVHQVARRDFAVSVLALLARHGFPPAKLWLEITESRLLTASESAVAGLNVLRESGVRIAVDDFGTGYSSLTYLKTLPIDALKIDKSFVDGFASDTLRAEDRAIVRSVIDLANNFGVTTVAEGVETEGQLAILSALGCAQAQGYYWGRPMPPDELQNWLSDARGAAGSSASAARPGLISVLIVEDQPSTRQLFKLMIEDDERFAVVAEAEDGRSAVAMARQHRPDIVVLDMAMPGLGGLEALPMIRAVSPGTQILVVTGSEEHDLERRSAANGASGFLIKTGEQSRLLDAIRRMVPSDE